MMLRAKFFRGNTPGLPNVGGGDGSIHPYLGQSPHWHLSGYGPEPTSSNYRHVDLHIYYTNANIDATNASSSDVHSELHFYYCCRSIAVNCN